MFRTIRNPTWPAMSRLAPIEDRQVQPRRSEENTEQPEDRPGRAGPELDVAEGERRERAADRRDHIEGNEPERSVEPLDDRPDEVQRVHVQPEVDEGQREGVRLRAAVDEGHRHEPPDLAGGEADLSSQGRRRCRTPFEANAAASETAIVIPRIE